jgi:methyl-accepting chemotaxis protein
MDIVMRTSSTLPYYRRKLFLSAFVILLLGAFCIAAGLHALFPSELGERYGAAITTLQKVKQMLIPRVAGLFAVMTGLLVLVTTLLHHIYTHRIVGPAFRLGREANRIGRGDLTVEIILRRKDNMTDLADALNLASSGMWSKWKKKPTHWPERHSRVPREQRSLRRSRK